MTSELLSTIWQGGQLAIPVRMILAKVKRILGAFYYTPAMHCSVIYAQQTYQLSGAMSNHSSLYL